MAFSAIVVAVKELNTLHDRHLNRPTLDDSMDEEHAIEIQTQEITQVCKGGGRAGLLLVICLLWHDCSCN